MQSGSLGGSASASGVGSTTIYRTAQVLFLLQQRGWFWGGGPPSTPRAFHSPVSTWLPCRGTGASLGAVVGAAAEGLLWNQWLAGPSLPLLPGLVSTDVSGGPAAQAASDLVNYSWIDVLLHHLKR